MKTETMCFVVYGADFTRMARERLLEDDPGHAWRIASCIMGDEGAERVAIEILQGKTRLTGDSSSGMTPEIETAVVREAHENALAWLYAGRIRINGLWYRPIAHVTDCGPNDMKNDHGRVVRPPSSGKFGGYINRPWHYARPKEIVPDETPDIIFEPCGELPHWMQPTLSPAVAVEAWRAVGRTLEERSHSLWYSFSEPVTDEARDAAVEAEELAAAWGTPAQRDARRDAEYAEQDRRKAERRAAWRSAILEQAKGDLIKLTWPATGKHPAGEAMIPRTPFVRWVVERYPRLRHLGAPTWNNVCPWGMKLQNDSSDHSDWMIGGGLFDALDDGYLQHPSYDAAISLMSEMLEELGQRINDGILILSPGHCSITSRVVHGKLNTPSPIGSIVVLPDLRPAYLAAIKDAAAVLTEAGGAASHLANVGRDCALPMLLVPDALRRFAAGARITVDAENGGVDLAREANDEDAPDVGPACYPF
jgi:phosphohistidine swiveling domain-containing protein